MQLYFFSEIICLCKKFYILLQRFSRKKFFFFFSKESSDLAQNLLLNHSLNINLKAAVLRSQMGFINYEK